jgi:hypothetical protein
MIFDFFQDGIKWQSIERRCAFSAAVNIIPLYISKGPLTRFLNVSRTSQQLFHHWVGRVAIAEALSHGSIVLAYRAYEPGEGSLVTSGWAVRFMILLNDID